MPALGPRARSFCAWHLHDIGRDVKKRVLEYFHQRKSRTVLRVCTRVFGVADIVAQSFFRRASEKVFDASVS